MGDNVVLDIQGWGLFPSALTPAWLGIRALPQHPTRAFLPDPGEALTASSFSLSLSWTAAQSPIPTCTALRLKPRLEISQGGKAS